MGRKLESVARRVRRHRSEILDRPVMAWYVSEALRRSRLREFESTCSVVLASYPRSGNHAVRALIESIFLRPTLGAGDSELYRFPKWLVDRPVGLRLKPPIHYTSLSPVAVKRHEFLEMDRWDKLIEIVRDPRDAIVSHTKELAFPVFQRRLSTEVALWLQHIERLEEWKPEKRINIRYSDVTERPGRVLSQLETFLQLAPTCAPDFSEIDLRGRTALTRPPTSQAVLPSVQFPERATLVTEEVNRVRPLKSLAPWF